MSPNHPRFTKSSIDRVKDFKIDNLHVETCDFKQSLKRHCNDFLYLDPPYLTKEKLYGHHGNTHENFDHQGLASIITRRDSWVLSYNDCPKVRELYKGFKAIPLKWSYGMNNSKKSNELIILSRDFI